MNGADAIAIVARIWNERTRGMYNARRELAIARLENRVERLRSCIPALETLEREVDALAYALDMMRKG